jgi:hypothetical protein
MKIISRAEAKRLGLKRYFTGKPCKHGHIDERYISRMCVSCNQEHSHKYYPENRERQLEYGRRYREANRERLLKYYRKRYAENTEEKRAYQHKYYLENRERIAEHARKSYAANPEPTQERSRKYHAANRERILERKHQRLSEAMDLLRIVEEREALHVTT